MLVNFWLMLGWLVFGGIFVVVAFIAWQSSKACVHFRESRDRLREDHQTLMESLKLAGQWPTQLMTERDQAWERNSHLDEAILAFCKNVEDLDSASDLGYLKPHLEMLKAAVVEFGGADPSKAGVQNWPQEEPGAASAVPAH